MNVSNWMDRMATGTGLPVNSDQAKKLMDLTLGIESNFGKYRKQFGGGPAEGMFQIEPTTRKDIYRYVRARQPKIRDYLRTLDDGHEKDAVLARTLYWSSPGAIPSDDTQLGQYWKTAYQKGGEGVGASAAQAQEKWEARQGKKKLNTFQDVSPQMKPETRLLSKLDNFIQVP